jgi:hypothetical protein
MQSVAITVGGFLWVLWFPPRYITEIILLKGALNTINQTKPEITCCRLAMYELYFFSRLSVLLENLRPNTDLGLERTLGGPTTMMQTGIIQAREIDDPPGLHDKAEMLLRDWVTMFHSPQAGRDSTKAFTAFVQQV